MDITIDTSVVLGVVCDEPGRTAAIRATTGHSLIAPASLRWEVGNALSAMVKRQRITPAQARSCLAAFSKIPIKLVDIDLVQAVALAARFRAYAHDAYMLLCAQANATPLLTFDDALKVHAADLGIEVLEI